MSDKTVIILCDGTPPIQKVAQFDERGVCLDCGGSGYLTYEMGEKVADCICRKWEDT